MSVDDIIKYSTLAIIAYASFIMVIYILISWRVPKIIHKMLKRNKDDKKR